MSVGTSVFLAICLIVLVSLAIVVATILGIIWLYKRIFNAMRQGIAEGTSVPDHATAPRGVGGLTAAQTTAMASNLLGALGVKPTQAPDKSPDTISRDNSSL